MLGSREREFCQISKYEEIPFLVNRNLQVNDREVYRNGLLVRMGVSIALKVLCHYTAN